MTVWSGKLRRREFLIRSGAAGVSSLAVFRGGSAVAASSVSSGLDKASTTTLIGTVAAAAGVKVAAGDVDLAVARLQEWASDADPDLRDWVVLAISDSVGALAASGPAGLREIVRSPDPSTRARGTALVDLAGMAIVGPDYHYQLAV